MPSSAAGTALVALCTTTGLLVSEGRDTAFAMVLTGLLVVVVADCEEGGIRPLALLLCVVATDCAEGGKAPVPVTRLAVAAERAVAAVLTLALGAAWMGVDLGSSEGAGSDAAFGMQTVTGLGVGGGGCGVGGSGGAYGEADFVTPGLGWTGTAVVWGRRAGEGRVGGVAFDAFGLPLVVVDAAERAGMLVGFGVGLVAELVDGG